ncbi:MAG: tellurite resistance TerB family protein [Hyphomicrobiaceae bacterium]
MFDARSLLEGMMGGGARQAPAQGGGLGDILGQLQRQLGQQGGSGAQGGGGLGDILGQLQRQLGQQGGAPAQAPQAAPGAGAGDGGLGDLMRNMFPGGDAQGRAASDPGAAPRGGDAPAPGGLDDILGQLQRQLGGGAAGRGGEAHPGDQPSGGGGGLFDMLGKVLGQATQGAREGAGRIGEATGASDALGRMTGGRSADELLGQLKELIQNNKLGAGAALGGLGALVLGTQTGRSVAGAAARIGALALIGGLAYKAMQNYQAGRPLITGADPVQPAPQGSGFEAEAVTNDTATLYLQAMIAAAAADGRLDETEQQRIMAGLQQAGALEGAEEFIAEEFNNPAEPEALADAVETEEQAVQLYTAARLAIDPDTDAEKQFLARLAATLELDPKLVAHVDASARGVA